MNKNRQRLIDKTEKYLHSVLGIGFRMADAGDTPVNLPYYLRAGNQFVLCILDNQKRLLIMPEELADGSTMAKRTNEIYRMTGIMTVLLLDNIDAIRRRVLVSNRTDFIVPGKQVYLPSMGTIFTERGMLQKDTTDKQNLSPSAQVLLLSHLQKESFESRIISEVAREFPYSIKAISAAVKELEQAGICITDGDNGGKYLHFMSKAKIWETAYPILSTPIQEILYCNNIDAIPSDIRFITYDKALSEYTFIADFDKKAFAVYKNDNTVKRLKNNGTLNKVEGMYRIEFWKYDPSLLAKGDIVDALSLSLCYKNSDDERVIDELNNMVKGICKD